MGMKLIISCAIMASVVSAVLADVSSFQEGVLPAAGYTHDATYIRSTAPDTNLDDDPDKEFIVGTTQTSDKIRSLLEFDLVAIAPTDQVDAVSLVMTTHSNPGLDQGGTSGNPVFNVYSYAYDISETVATWNSAGSGDPTPGGTLGTLLTSASFDVTSTNMAVTFGDTVEFRNAVSNALAGDGVLRLVIAKNDESTVGTHEFTRFAADSFSTTANRPKLVVTHSVGDPLAPGLQRDPGWITWSGQQVLLDTTVTNNDPGSDLIYEWAVDSASMADGNLGITVTEQADPADATVLISKTSPTGGVTVVTVTLTVTRPGSDPVSADMLIDVYDDPCVAGEAVGQASYDPTDLNYDCMTDLEDFAILASRWVND